MIFDLRTTTIIVALALIILIGSLTVYSVTSIDIYYVFRFLLINIFAILLVTLIFNQINLNRILSVGWVLFLLNILIVLSVEFLGNEVKGSRSWLGFGFLSVCRAMPTHAGTLPDLAGHAGALRHLQYVQCHTMSYHNVMQYYTMSYTFSMVQLGLEPRPSQCCDTTTCLLHQ